MRRVIPIQEAERLYRAYGNWRRVAVHLRFTCRTNFTTDGVQGAVNRARRKHENIQTEDRLRANGSLVGRRMVVDLAGD